MTWICLIMANSHKPDGTKVIMRRYIECAGDIEGGIKKALCSRRDKGQYFLGEEITAITTIGD